MNFRISKKNDWHVRLFEDSGNKKTQRDLNGLDNRQKNILDEIKECSFEPNSDKKKLRKEKITEVTFFFIF